MKTKLHKQTGETIRKVQVGDNFDKQISIDQRSQERLKEMTLKLTTRNNQKLQLTRIIQVLDQCDKDFRQWTFNYDTDELYRCEDVTVDISYKIGLKSIVRRFGADAETLSNCLSLVIDWYYETHFIHENAK